MSHRPPELDLGPYDQPVTGAALSSNPRRDRMVMLLPSLLNLLCVFTKEGHGTLSTCVLPVGEAGSWDGDVEPRPPAFHWMRIL